MGRLADPNVPGTDKVGLVEYGTPDDAAALDRFGKALHDSGFTPVTFEATDLTWSQADAGNVIANIIIKPANRQAGRDFTFPMEFSPTQRLLAVDPADRGPAPATGPDSHGDADP